MVDTVIVAGSVVKQHGRLIGRDLASRANVAVMCVESSDRYCHRREIVLALDATNAAVS